MPQPAAESFYADFIIPSIPATYFPTQPPQTHIKGRSNVTTTHQQLPPHLDPRPVLIPILSGIIFFPIIAFIIICALRYRAMRLRRKEHRKRLRGGIRGGRGMHVPIPALGERSSYFSQNSSSGETASRQPIGVPSSNRHSSQMSRTTSSLQVPTTSSYQGTHRTSRSTSLSIFEPSFMEDSSDEDKDNDKEIPVFEEEPKPLKNATVTPDQDCSSPLPQFCDKENLTEVSFVGQTPPFP
ncbi:uncharacterized protein LOC114828497 [Galendromus occidentalis]|uniref:Uncharacterized protein LOC114828497 n=1 Tax=Galendromus occidentalis TaxID=34638 RepID=A0AAJ7WJ23_9ACAR|nr:uncharacterized protein LOC114828497 [Galendromus occidentalis]